MKKLIAVIIVIVLIVTFSLCLASCDDPNDIKDINKDNFYSKWLNCIEDSAKVTSVAIPGTHDSGTLGMNVIAETQGSTIKEQLTLGARYFDIRVHKNKNGKLTIFHGGVTNGMEFLPILDDIKAFIDANPSEFVIMDFQHFSGDSQLAVIDALDEKGLLDIAVSNTTDMKDLDYIESLTVKDVRGKVIICWGSSEADTDNYDYLFRRNNDSCSLPGCSLDSLYYSSENTKPSELFIKESLPLYFSHILEKNKGLLVLQGQLTPGQGSPATLENKHNDAMNKYVRAIKDDAARLDAVNIIMRDFFEQDIEKADSTLSLNIYKKIIKSDYLTIYSEMCEPEQ